MTSNQKKLSAVVLSGSAVVLAFIFWQQGHYFSLNLLIVFLAFFLFFLRFERKQIKPEVVVIIATLAAIAAVSRLPFASLPSVQPTSFVVIVSALVFGPEVGFMVGSSSALVSNFMFGHGPWTPLQMFGWGMMGLTAGLLRTRAFMENRIGKSVFGFAWGFIFGWIMNLWFVLGFFDAVSLELFLSVYAASFYFDLAHALTNVFLISLFSKHWQKILSRINVKYGVL